VSRAATVRTAAAPVGAGAVRPDEFRAALEQTLRAVAADDRLSPLINAAQLQLRFSFPDSGLVLNLAAGESGEGLRWSFGDDVEWRPKLELEMDSDVANRYLQGSESLAIAIARGQARFRGESRVALLYLPAARLLCEPYRRVVAAEFPDLRAAA
jgi:hypothetical protein